MICYDGVGALESGNHTPRQYLNVMNKHFKRECPRYFRGLKCAACKHQKALFKKEIRGIRKAEAANLPYERPKEDEQLEKRLSKKCHQCKKTKRKCTLKQYLKFSGATRRTCPKK